MRKQDNSELTPRGWRQKMMNNIHSFRNKIFLDCVQLMPLDCKQQRNWSQNLLCPFLVGLASPLNMKTKSIMCIWESPSNEQLQQNFYDAVEATFEFCEGQWDITRPSQVLEALRIFLSNDNLPWSTTEVCPPQPFWFWYLLLLTSLPPYYLYFSVF